MKATSWTKYLTVAAAGLLGLGACRDAGVAPETGPGSVALNIDWGTPVAVDQFTVYPGQTTVEKVFGDHRIKFEKDAVCDPAVSTYGEGEWDAPCQPATQPITITATYWRDRAGHPRVDFQPSLRFVPGKTVELKLKNRAGANPADYAMVWMDNAGRAVDDAKADASLAAVVEPGDLLRRRIKHFTGYAIVVRSSLLDAEVGVTTGGLLGF